MQKVEKHIVGKEEIARYEQFILFPSCFQKTCTVDTSKQRLVWERVDTLHTTPSVNGSSDIGY